MSTNSYSAWYTPKQLGDLLGLHPVNIRKLISAGEIEAINAGSGNKKPSWRISHEAYLAFCEARKNKTASRSRVHSRPKNMSAPVKSFF